jgi:hypothetical protein
MQITHRTESVRSGDQINHMQCVRTTLPITLAASQIRIIRITARRSSTTQLQLKNSPKTQPHRDQPGLWYQYDTDCLPDLSRCTSWSDRSPNHVSGTCNLKIGERPSCEQIDDERWTSRWINTPTARQPLTDSRTFAHTGLLLTIQELSCLYW